jgi:EXLDI family protein
MVMATKNIYVSDSDLPLLERAARLAGGVSAAVMAGVRLYLEQKERAQRNNEMHQIEVKVQDGALLRTKRFSGRELLRYVTREHYRARTYRVYVTARGQFAVHVRDSADWNAWSSPDDDRMWEDPKSWLGGWWGSTARSLTVFPDIEAMAGDIPGEVIDAVRRALAEPLVEDLDI